MERGVGLFHSIKLITMINSFTLPKLLATFVPNDKTLYLLSSIFLNLQLTTKLNANFTTAQQWFTRTMLITLSVLKMNIKIKIKINYSIIVSLISTSTSIYFLTDFTGTCLLNSVWVPMSTFAFLSLQTFSPYIFTIYSD